jgi:transglutaminase-like putative cysteine protease
MALLTALPALLIAAASLSPAAPRAQGTDTWYVVRIGGSTVGTASESLVADSSSIVFSAHMSVRFTRLGTPLSMMVLTEEVSDSSGNLLRSHMESTLSNSSSTASMDGDSVRYESRVGDSVDRRSFAWETGAVTEAVAAQRLRAWVTGAAAETTMTIFDISEGGFRVQRFVRAHGADAESAEAGQVVVDEFDEDAQSPSSTIWFDHAGETVRTVVRQLGVEISIERIDAADVDKIEVEPDFDIIRQSMVPCDGFPRPVQRIKDVTLRLEFAGLPPSAPMTGPNMIETYRGDHVVEVRLTRDASVRMTEDAASLQRFLQPDRFVQSGDASLRAVADSIRSATRERGWNLARDITAWVNEYIVHKGMEHGYASALDVYRTRAGDCTEHSLLTVALLRASGIPARPVVGLVYSEGDGAFVGHMWVEAYVDQWRTLDALNLPVDPIHLRVHAPQGSETLGERDLLRAYGAVAGVSVSVVDYHLN